MEVDARHSVELVIFGLTGALVAVEGRVATGIANDAVELILRVVVMTARERSLTRPYWSIKRVAIGFYQRALGRRDGRAVGAMPGCEVGGNVGCDIG